MIKYQLLCDADHEFEGWFRDSADFDAQSDDGLIECPACGSDGVRKAVMSPSIARRRSSSAREMRLAEIRRDMGKAMERARDYVEKNYDYVGKNFPDEARKIHYGEAEERGIYGEASGKEVKELVDEGVSVAPLPKAAKADSDKADIDKASVPKKLDPVENLKSLPVPDDAKKLN